MENNNMYEDSIKKIIPNPADLFHILEKNNRSKKIVLVKGVYDLFHIGHYLSFINAKSPENILVVAVNTDRAVRARKGENRPIINQSDRATLVAALSYVDWVTFYNEESPYNVLKTVKPDIFAASHFDSLSEEEKKELSTFIEFKFIPKLGNNSTTSIIQKIKRSY